MNENVRLPIETVREGNKITKTCVEDIHKISNRVIDVLDKVHNNSMNIINATTDKQYGERSSVVYGKGISQPCLTDAFDEEIGNDVAFIKMKLNANIKKHNILIRIYNELIKGTYNINEELMKIDYYIKKDLNRMRTYNQDYLKGIESELDII